MAGPRGGGGVPRNVVVDAGPLVALLHVDDARHRWAAAEIARLRPPLLSCEPALAEAAHLIARAGGDPGTVVALVTKGVVRIGIAVQEQANQLEALMRKYRSVPMSLADACLVRMSELLDEAVIMTFDADFHVYRRHGRAVIPLLSPSQD